MENVMYFSDPKTLVGGAVFLQRNLELYKQFGLSAIDAFAQGLQEVMLPFSTFTWKNVEFITTEKLLYKDHCINRNYHWNKETGKFQLTGFSIGGEDTKYPYQYFEVNKIPEFLENYRNLVQNFLCTEFSVQIPKGKIVFETEEDLENFQKQCFFKNTKDLEKILSVFLEEEGSYLVGMKFENKIEAKTADGKKIEFFIKGSDILEVHFQGKKTLYRLNPVEGNLKSVSF